MSTVTKDSAAGQAAAAERRRKLVYVGLSAYFVGYLVHTVEHLVSLMPATPIPTIVAGTLAWVLLGVLFAAAAKNHRLTALGTCALGVATTIGLLAIHTLSHWGPLSQPWVGSDSSTTTVMWLSLIVAAAGSLTAAVAGALAYRIRLD